MRRQSLKRDSLCGFQRESVLAIFGFGSVRAATKTHGPAMRFVANPGNWDESILLITTGQSGQPGSSHYSDQFPYWYEGKPIFAPFSDAAEDKDRKHTLTLKPAQ